MKSSHASRIMKIICCFVTILMCFGCVSNNTVKSDYKSEFFQFDPKTILARISNSSDNLFIQINSKDFKQEGDLPYVIWEPNDFWLVADTFFMTKFNESIYNWKINQVDYDVHCDEVDFGTQWFYLEVYKEIQSGKQQNREVKRVIVEPSTGYLELVEYSYQNIKKPWEEVDISKLSKNIKDLYPLIDLNGGLKVREKTKNKCNISISINSTNGEPVWTVVYELLPEGKLLYEFQIDDESGEITIVQPIREEIIPH
jgi:hypothetical protein